jgi:hypothetical protein
MPKSCQNRLAQRRGYRLVYSRAGEGTALTAVVVLVRIELDQRIRSGHTCKQVLDAY